MPDDGTTIADTDTGTTTTGTDTAATTTTTTQVVGATADAPAAAAAAKPAASAADQTLAAGEVKDDATKTTVGDFPADWREKMAGGDEKVANILSRYTTPKAVADALLEVRNKISKGELKAAAKLPEGATEDQIKAWRAENGIPESPDKYDTTLPDGLVIGEADKPLVDDFLKSAHDANLPPTAVKAALGWYYKTLDAKQEQQTNQDKQFRKDAEDALRQEWGPEFRVNVALFKEALDELPNEMGKRLLTARDETGRLLGADPDFVSYWVGRRRETNPIGTVVPGSGSGGIAALADQIATIEKSMGDPKGEYRNGPKVTRQVPGLGAVTKTKMEWQYDQLLADRARLSR